MVVADTLSPPHDANHEASEESQSSGTTTTRTGTAEDITDYDDLPDEIRDLLELDPSEEKGQSGSGTARTPRKSPASACGNARERVRASLTAMSDLRRRVPPSRAVKHRAFKPSMARDEDVEQSLQDPPSEDEADL